MKFIGGAVKKCMSSDSTWKEISRTRRIWGACCGVRCRATEWVENRTIFLLLSLCHGTHFALSEMESEVRLKDLAASQLEVEPWLSACSSEHVRKAVEAFEFASVLRKKVKQMLSETCSMRKRAECDTFLQRFGVSL